MFASCSDSIDITTPENTAKSFWRALQKKDIDAAVKFYLTVAEANQTFGPQVAGKWGERLNREIRQLQNEHIPDVENGKWDKFEIEDSEYEYGHKMVEANIYFNKNGNTHRLGLAIVNIEDKVWKITDVD